MKVGVLYVAIGNYWMFWEDFYSSCEEYFLPDVEKEYFVFTDKKVNNEYPNVIFFFQEDCGWPGNTLFRFDMFYKQKQYYSNCTFLFFFNSNSLFLDTIGLNEFIPSRECSYLLALSWELYKEKKCKDYPYERNVSSRAYIPYEDGTVYYQGGINGGRKQEYLELIKYCRDAVNADFSEGIIAIHHDESHLNKYLLNRKIRILGSIYGKPQEWDYPEDPKIIFRDKNNFLGSSYIKELKKEVSQPFFNRLISFFVRFIK